MRKSKPTRKEIDYAEVIKRMAYYFADIDYARKSRVTEGSYYYIPIDIDRLYYLLDVVKEEFRKTDDTIYPKFIDCGCGIGLTSLLAKIKGFDNYGIELSSQLCKIARGLSHGTIFQEDIMEFDRYNEYDVIYYYCPFHQDNIEKTFERKIENEMKVGAYIVACHKMDYGIRKDNRFKTINDGDIGLIYKKVSEN